MQRNKGNKSKNILIARFSALGDIAMTIPTVYNACRANPDRHFYFLTRHHPASLFINAPENLTVVGVDLENYKGIAGIYRLASSLKVNFPDNTHTRSVTASGLCFLLSYPGW